MLSGNGQLGVDREDSSQVGFGLFEVALVSKNDATIVVGDRVFGLQRERRIRVFESPLKLAEPDPGQAAVAKQDGRLFRLEGERSRQIINGGQVVALIQSKRAA